jgi:Leucine-rich repeat (LRR) protein
LGGLDNLEYLNCEENDLVELKDLPESLEELYCDNNDITKLNLIGMERLRVLHCSNNKLMVLQNLPPGLTDFKMENNPLAEIDHDAHSHAIETEKHDEETMSKINYIESLNDYFRLKEKYTTKAYQLRKKAFKTAPNKRTGKIRAARLIPPCINCKRKVGSVFTKADEKYIALCGDKDAPCNLNIQLFTSDFYKPEDLLNSYKEIVDESKENIIRQKLDNLFNYVSEKTSADMFKKELQKYTEASKLYQDFLEEYNDIFYNPLRKELISRKTQEINQVLENLQEMKTEYLKTSNEELLTTIMHTYMEDLIPKIENLRHLRYPVMEMYEETPDTLRLVQREVQISKYDYSYTEPPKVIKYQTKSDDI